jgi:hypothetical protein
MPGWLTRRKFEHSNCPQPRPATLKIAAYGFATNQESTGETMSIQTRAQLHETARDCLIVSAFGFWALLLGFMPVVAIHALVA